MKLTDLVKPEVRVYCECNCPEHFRPPFLIEAPCPLLLIAEFLDKVAHSKISRIAPLDRGLLFVTGTCRPANSQT
jgi:hypothetical protein